MTTTQTRPRGRTLSSALVAARASRIAAGRGLPLDGELEVEAQVEAFQLLTGATR